MVRNLDTIKESTYELNGGEDSFRIKNGKRENIGLAEYASEKLIKQYLVQLDRSNTLDSEARDHLYQDAQKRNYNHIGGRVFFFKPVGKRFKLELSSKVLKGDPNLSEGSGFELDFNLQPEEGSSIINIE
ncbi:hypothetical protein GOV14_06330 [Candidatus Pacearchaeota archaeon]|nr:hypothetical protein [Candidatus Pacearchaeota archaeon]